eukprot:gene38178-51559_t
MRKTFLHVYSILINFIVLQIIKEVHCDRSLLFRQMKVKRLSRSCIPLRMHELGSKSESATEFTLTPQVHHDAGSPYYDASTSESKLYQGSEIAFQGPFSSHAILMKWVQEPKRVLFLSKPDSDVYELAEDAIEYLQSKNLQVIVEESMYSHLLQANKDINSTLLEIFDLNDKSVDIIILFGGDGLLLYCSTLFQNRSMPPVIFFDFGSFGFLSPFYYDDFITEINRLLTEKTALLTLRMRLECTVLRNNTAVGVYHVLNEAVIDR